MKKGLKIPTDRSFGYTFAGVFTLLAMWQLWHANRWGFAALSAACVSAVVAATVPRVLHPLNIVWMRFGLLLNKIVSPIALGAVFVIVFIPVGMLFRLIKRDVLRRHFEPDRPTYWLERTPPGPEGKNFPRQF